MSVLSDNLKNRPKTGLSRLNQPTRKYKPSYTPRNAGNDAGSFASGMGLSKIAGGGSFGVSPMLPLSVSRLFGANIMAGHPDRSVAGAPVRFNAGDRGTLWNGAPLMPYEAGVGDVNGKNYSPDQASRVRRVGQGIYDRVLESGNIPDFNVNVRDFSQYGDGRTGEGLSLAMGGDKNWVNWGKGESEEDFYNKSLAYINDERLNPGRSKRIRPEQQKHAPSLPFNVTARPTGINQLKKSSERYGITPEYIKQSRTPEQRRYRNNMAGQSARVKALLAA